MRWRNQLSLDIPFRQPPHEHVIELFKDNLRDPVRHLDFRIWFDELEVLEEAGHAIPLQEFADGGTRWWDALYGRDPRTQGHGIGPLTG
jgi:hypothetical protein